MLNAAKTYCVMCYASWRTHCARPVHLINPSASSVHSSLQQKAAEKALAQTSAEKAIHVKRKSPIGENRHAAQPQHAPRLFRQPMTGPAPCYLFPRRVRFFLSGMRERLLAFHLRRRTTASLWHDTFRVLHCPAADLVHSASSRSAPLQASPDWRCAAMALRTALRAKDKGCCLP